MLIIEPCAGLSNRILALATAYQLAKEYHHRIKLLWDVDKTVGIEVERLFLLPENIQVITMTKAPLYQKPLLALKSKAIRKWYRAKSDLFLDCCDISESLKKNDGGLVREALKKYEIVYIKSFSELEKITDYKIFEIFQISSEIMEKGQEVFEKIDNKTIGMHIRRTDHEDAIEKSPMDLFILKAKELLEGSEISQIYLATDDRAVEEEMKDIFKDKIITYSSKTFSRCNLDGMQDGVIDLLALSKCRKIYGSYGSTFSKMASYLGNCSLTILQKE